MEWADFGCLGHGERFVKKVDVVCGCCGWYCMLQFNQFQLGNKFIYGS
jgi:hypothetical protein